MEISVKNSDIALLCQKGGCRAVETTAARCHKRNAFFFTSLQSTPPTRVYP